MHLQLVTASATASAAVGSAGAAVAGDSLTVQNANPAKGAAIVSLWQTNNTNAGFGQIAFPSGHDTTRGYRYDVSAGPSLPNPFCLPAGIAMKVTPQELISVLIGANAVAADVDNLSMLIWYGDMPGIDGRYLTAAEADSRIEKMTTVQAAIVSAAGPGYSGEVALNAGTDLLLANRDYVILGAKSRTSVHAITIRGPDLGNVRIGSPGVLRDEIASQWYLLLSRAHQLPMVPVINSGNKQSTLIGVATDENAGTFNVTLFLGLLKK
jgi:hypothetical protein